MTEPEKLDDDALIESVREHIPNDERLESLIDELVIRLTGRTAFAYHVLASCAELERYAETIARISFL